MQDAPKGLSSDRVKEYINGKWRTRFLQLKSLEAYLETHDEEDTAGTDFDPEEEASNIIVGEYEHIHPDLVSRLWPPTSENMEQVEEIQEEMRRHKDLGNRK